MAKNKSGNLLLLIVRDDHGSQDALGNEFKVLLNGWLSSGAKLLIRQPS
jgi:hypothetical protein